MLRPEEQTKVISDVIHKNIGTIFPIKVGERTLEVSNLETQDLTNADPRNYHAISEAKDKDKTYGIHTYGDVVLKEGDKIIDKKRMKLATTPVMCADGTYVVQGSQFAVDKQLRLRPGIYSRIAQNGEIEAYSNPNGFKNMRFKIDPSTKKLMVNVNQANINALPVLHILGVSDDEMIKTFGKDIYDANVKHVGKKTEEEIKRFYKSINPRDEMPSDKKEIFNSLAESLRNAKLDPKVTKITLGQPFAHLDGRAMLRGFEKVVNVSRGLENPDDRDTLAFKTIHSVEDFVDERIKKNSKKIQFDIANKMRKNDKLDSIMHSGHINQHIFSFFNSAALSEIPSQINPLAIMNAGYKTTITGEGGIENDQAIMAESQALHPSHMGYLDPINTPESKKIGVTLNLSVNTRKQGNDLYSKMVNVKTGKEEWIAPIDGHHLTIALPGQKLSGTVTAIHEGKQIEVDASKVTHQLPTPYSAFTMSSQALPALNHNQSNRASMASRHITQAVSLKHREAPLVQVVSPIIAGKTTEQYLGENHDITVKAPYNGKITKITKSHIEFTGDHGKVEKIPHFNHFNLQNKSYLHHEIEGLKVGSTYKKGDVIADSNFTKNGTLALGTNLRLAYMPWKGLNFEDGIVVSETAANKLTSNHLFQDHIDKDGDSIIVDKKKFVTMYPTKYTKEQLAKIGDNGLALPDAKLNPGDPYALVLHKTQGTQEDLILNRLHKSLVQPFKDMSKTWEQLTPGVVTRSVFNNGNVKVHAKYEAPATVGDKLALRHGNKGVITAIVPDEEMPHSKDGKHTEVILSPLSITSRMSIGQMLENSASKIAEKTGKPYVIENFSDKNQLEKIKADLVKHGLSDTEELFDKKTGHSYGHIMVGKPIVNKLFKTAKANVSARDYGQYGLDNQPVKGGEEGSKAVDPLTLYGLLAHGKRGILNEVATVKGDGNAQFWQNIQHGLPLPKPQVPFVYKKFESLLTASGVNVRQDGSKKILTPLIDSHVNDLAGKNEIEHFKMLDHNLEPIAGGLFDPVKTGGSNGQKWSKITLAHPIVNPMFETSVKSLLGLKDSEFRALLSEEKGHEKVKDMLSKINVRERIDIVKNELEKAPKTKKDKLLKELKLLKSLDHLNLAPHEAYTTSVVPVVPPQFRPVFEIPGGHLHTSSLNFLYRDLGTVNETIKQFGATPELSQTLYQSLGAIQGVMDPTSKQNEAKEVKGAMKIITGGGSPKHGFFQNTVLRKQQDLTGRATVVLNDNLGMDQIAIPEKIAKVIYKPFAMKELLRNGYAHKEAEQHIEEFTETGKKAVQAAMADRPVMMNRAPSLHKFSIMAFQPTLTKGLSIEVPGLIVKPYGMDFDGDTAVLHTPVTEKARKEAFDLMPSKNLYDPANRRLNYTLDQEAVMGLHLLSEAKDGLSKVNALLPKDIPHFDKVITKDEINKILSHVAEKHPNQYADIAHKLKDLGDHYGTQAGFTVSLKDLPNNEKMVKDIFKPALSALGSKSLSSKHKLEALLKADKELKSKSLDDTSNRFVKMVTSQSKGSVGNIAQITTAPGLLTDHNGQVIMRPVLGNYGQGMDFPDYWTGIYSARKGSLDKQLMTAKPGDLNKQIVNTSMNLVISEHDCGTHHGLEMSSHDGHIVGRYTTDGTLISKSNLDSFKKKDHVIVRSPSSCQSPHGICQKCYGIDEYGHLPKIGDNVGIKAAQSISQPLTQAAMKTFHTGGIASAGGGITGGFEAVHNFITAPETFKNKATLASIGGKITSIKAGAAGGHHVEIDGKEHFVNPLSGDLKVKVGDHVKVGDLLNNGIPHPKDAISLLGENKGIHMIVDTLHKIYKESGISTDRRNLETVVRGTTGFGIIKDEGTHKHYVKNDVVPLSSIYAFNQQANKPKKVDLHESFGMILSHNTDGVKAGTVIDSNVIKTLSKKHKQIEAHHEPINYERTMIGVTQAPLKHQDWMSQLGYRYLKRGIQEGAMYGYESDVHGHNPIASFVTGNIADPDEHGRY